MAGLRSQKFIKRSFVLTSEKAIDRKRRCVGDGLYGSVSFKESLLISFLFSNLPPKQQPLETVTIIACVLNSG